MRQTRAMSRRQSQTTVSQLDGIDDRQNEQTKTKQKNKTKNPPPRTGKCEQNILKSPLDNILSAQSKLSDESFISRLPSQVPHILYLDAC